MELIKEKTNLWKKNGNKLITPWVGKKLKKANVQTSQIGVPLISGNIKFHINFKISIQKY